MTRRIPRIVHDFLNLILSVLVLLAACWCVSAAFSAPATQPTTQPTTQPAKVAPRPIGVMALSDALNDWDPAGNPDRFQWAIIHGDKPTLGRNVVAFIEGAADRAKAYGCESLLIWTGFGGSRWNDQVGYNSDVLDAAQGITLADVRDSFTAIASRGVRPGIIIRPQRIVMGANRPKIDGGGDGQSLWQASMARGCGAMDFYADSNGDEVMKVVAKYPDARFVIEFWDPTCAAPNVLQWRGSSATFTNDHPQAVALAASDVDAPAKVAAWGKRLQSTGSTVLLNCRPDDPTLPARQAPILAAWRASQGK